MNYEIQTRSKMKQQMLSTVLDSYITQLNLSNSAMPLLIVLSNEVSGGLTAKLGTVCVVMINAKQTISNAVQTLAHEMVHVNQLAKGMMKTGSHGSTIWKGKRYPKATPYLEKPWEIDAFSKAELLFRRAIDSLEKRLYTTYTLNKRKQNEHTSTRHQAFSGHDYHRATPQ